VLSETEFLSRLTKSECAALTISRWIYSQFYFEDLTELRDLTEKYGGHNLYDEIEPPAFKVLGVLHLQLLGPSPEFDEIVNLEIRKYMNVEVID
jgi:hypothetical protein